MPAAFIGPGSPKNTLETNRFTAAWRAFGAGIPRPRAVLAISAHWYINGTAVTAMPQPRTIHDFFGFPPRLFEFQYRAPGSPEVAAEVADVLEPEYVGLDRDSWGIDHGTWSVLAHVFPAADIPVLQLSIHAARPAAYHLEIGRRLAPLRDRGVLILGSGNVVHNLRLIQFRAPELAYDWGERFDAAVREAMRRDPAAVAGMESHPDYARAVPTPEHWLPLLYLAGLCDAAGEQARPWAQGCTMGSISMTSYVLGDVAVGPASPSSEGAASLPDPDLVPPEATNT